MGGRGRGDGAVIQYLRVVKIQEWDHNWKMYFNSDRNKKAQEVMFSTKTRKGFHPNLYFND